MSALIVDEGFLVRKTPFKEGGFILQFITRDHGVISLLAQGIHRKSGPIKSAYLSPLSHLELVYYAGRGDGLRRLKESKAMGGVDSFSNPIHQTVLFFLAETCYHITKTGHHVEQLYEEINLLLTFMQHSSVIANVPLYFINRIARISGVLPNFEALHELEESGIQAATAASWKGFSELNFEGKMGYASSGQARSVLLDAMLSYLHIHLPHFGPLKSLEVLRTLL